MYPEVEKYIEARILDFDLISEERKNLLKHMANSVVTMSKEQELASIIFICTHNSRRSHISQIWSIIAAHFYSIQKMVASYSGGTESTEFSPKAVAALKRIGLKIESEENNNPHYLVRFSDKAEGLQCFSKKYDSDYNPQSNFIAIMTCSEADEACPIVKGATIRIPLQYVDPKISDGSESETLTYDESCKRIATEMLYGFSLIR